MSRAQEILEYASNLSYKYYGQPLVIVGDGRVLNLAKKTLGYFDMAEEPVNHRMCVLSTGKKAFCLKGVKEDKYFTYEHTKEVVKESVDDAVWDCVLVTGMRFKANVRVNPYARE